MNCTWISGQPDDFKHNEDCGGIFTTSTQWNDWPCNIRRGFVCKKFCKSFFVTWATQKQGEGTFKPIFLSYKLFIWAISSKTLMVEHSLCRLQSIATHRDHFVRRPSVRPSVRLSVRLSPVTCHTLQSYVSQATHAFLGMLPLIFLKDVTLIARHLGLDNLSSSRPKLC